MSEMSKALKDKLSELAKKFKRETIKVWTPTPVFVSGRQSGGVGGHTSTKNVPSNEQATVILAADFEHFVNTMFEFGVVPEGTTPKPKYCVNVDLNVAKRKDHDVRFFLEHEPRRDGKPMLDVFKRNGSRVGMAHYLLNHIKDSGFLPLGHVVIRFP